MPHCAIIETKWGWFGLLWSGIGLRRTCLPTNNRQQVQDYLTAGLAETFTPAAPDDTVVGLIQAYFDGRGVDVSRIQVDLTGFSPFQRAVLSALRRVSYGETVSYTELAEMAGRPNAVRAAAGAVGKNPLPLIIPCHRIVRKDGTLGGFSAPGGIEVKQRLLALEHRLSV